MCPIKGERAPGDELRALREAAGLTQAEAAKRLGMDTGTLSRKERGQNATTKTDLLAARVAFGGAEAASGEGGTLPSDQLPEGRPELERTADYWAGRQDALLDMMQVASRLQRQAAEWQDKAIQAQRALIANTTPAPRITGRPQDEREAALAEGLANEKARAGRGARAKRGA